MSEASVIVEKRDEICRLTLNRPEITNALNLDILTGLQDAVHDLSTDGTTRVIILQGTGGNFSAGADMNVLDAGHDSSEWLAWMKRFGVLIRALREAPQPIITKLQGAAAGGGANLALAADFIVAADSAQFGEVFVNIGAVLDGGGTYFLPRLVGLAKARELAMLGRFINGKEGAAIGLFYKSVPEEDLDGAVASLTKTLLRKPRTALALIKQGLDAGLNMSLKDVLDWEASHQAILLQTEEHKSAVKAFLNTHGRKD